MIRRILVTIIAVTILVPLAGADEPLAGLESRLKVMDVPTLALRARESGNARAGALVFYKSAAACIKCHEADGDGTPLGPSLAKLGAETTDEHIIESILYPSRKIKEGYATQQIVRNDGTTLNGMLVEQDAESVVLLDATELTREIVVKRVDIEELSTSRQSMMPEGLVASLQSEKEFYDLVRYVRAVARGGADKAKQLKPRKMDLVIVDDSIHLDHAGILRSLNDEDLQAGQRIYLGHCQNCHGPDGNEPKLPTARAFGKQPLKFGSDPYKMFLTLTRGGGLMSPMLHLSPKERYQVVHFIRESLMKSSNPEYQEVGNGYLERLPKGTLTGEFAIGAERDYGAVLGAQLRGEVQNGLHFRLPHEVSVCYDLHRGRLGGVWRGGFLDLSQTHHYRQRGEGMPRESGEDIAGMQGWQWQLAEGFALPSQWKPPRGPVVGERWSYLGHYLHGRHAVIRYAVHGRRILESIDARETDGLLTIEHTLRIEPGESELVLSIAQFNSATTESSFVPFAEGEPAVATEIAVSDGVALLDEGDTHVVATVVGSPDSLRGMTWSFSDSSRSVLRIPASDKARVIRVIRNRGVGEDEVRAFVDLVKNAPPARDLRDWTHGGPNRWPQELHVQGGLGDAQNGYALDTIPVPFANPWHAWVRTSAVDFFDDGRAVVTTHGGDVYIVSGIDDALQDVTWKRYVAGLFEPFGVRVVDDTIYVTARDGIKRLHDYDGNGECDFVEAFFVDNDVSCSFHAFNFDLQTDSQGNFYFAKSGQYSDHAIPGTIMRVPPNGGSAEMFAFGLRTPNGMGKLSDDRFTVSDNQGPWMPASKISLIRRGGFLGNMPSNDEQEAWMDKVFDGKLPKSFDEPIVWMPQEFDSSSGGQVWANDKRWGPLAGRLIHSSFGKGWLSYLSLQEVEGESGPAVQGSIIKLPHQWDAGVMRLRVNPADGQVYGTGLSGWQGPPRGQDGCLQRLRYTGDPCRIVESVEVTSEGIRLTFNFALDAKSVSDAESWEAEMWNYLWSAKYGSDQFTVKPPVKEGHDPLRVADVRVSGNNKIVDLTLPDLEICDQVRLQMHFKDAIGREFEEEVYMTVLAVP